MIIIVIIIILIIVMYIYILQSLYIFIYIYDYIYISNLIVLYIVCLDDSINHPDIPPLFRKNWLQFHLTCHARRAWPSQQDDDPRVPELGMTQNSGCILQ